MLRSWCAILVLCSLECKSLRLVSYHIPAIVDFRDQLEMSCEFDTEGAPFHSIRWFANGTEFYRYGPTLRPTKAFHYVDGISVQMDKSSKTSVVLSPLYFTTSGEFRCEASTAPPLYRTLAVSKKLEVVALPKGGPTIEGIHPTHVWGDDLELNCTSSPSYPPADLTWFIGDNPAPETWTREYKLDDDLRIQSRKNRLLLRTDDLPFENSGEITITCVALVPGIYRNAVSLRLAKARLDNTI